MAISTEIVLSFSLEDEKVQIVSVSRHVENSLYSLLLHEKYSSNPKLYLEIVSVQMKNEREDDAQDDDFYPRSLLNERIRKHRSSTISPSAQSTLNITHATQNILSIHGPDHLFDAFLNVKGLYYQPSSAIDFSASVITIIHDNKVDFIQLLVSHPYFETISQVELNRVEANQVKSRHDPIIPHDNTTLHSDPAVNVNDTFSLIDSDLKISIKSYSGQGRLLL